MKEGNRQQATGNRGETTAGRTVNKSLSLSGMLSPVACCLLPVAFLYADKLPSLALTLDDYTKLALQQGIRGLQNAATFENAGYTREIAFRQTDSPKFTAGYTGNRTENNSASAGIITHSDTEQASLTMNQTLPLGTQIATTGKYGDAGASNLNASIAQPLYLFVKNSVMRTRRQATLAYESAKDSFEAGLLSIRAQARSLYYDVILKEEFIKVEERKVAASRALHQVTLALVEAGKIAPVEATRSKIRVQRDERQLSTAQLERNKAILNAKSFISIPLDEPVEFLTQMEFNSFEIPLPKLVDYALIHRQELKNLRRAVELSRLSFDASQEPARPTLTFNTSYGYSQVNTIVNRNYTYGGAANWLFFDSFVTHDQVKIARIGEMVADWNLAEGERVARLQVQNAYLDVKNAEKQIMDFHASREQARRNVEVLRLRFQSGLERLIDVFDAENEARNLDNEFLGLLVNFNRTKDNLATLIGGELEKVQ